MSSTINAGAYAEITLSPTQTLVVSAGQGTAIAVSNSIAGAPQAIAGPARFGPYPMTTVVKIAATVAVSYDVSDQNAQSAALQALVTAYGNSSALTAQAASGVVSAIGVDSTGRMLDAAGKRKLATPQWRGIGHGMRVAVQGFTGGTNVWSYTRRSRHTANTRFRRFRLVYQCFQPTGTPIVDTLFASDFNLHVGFEQTYTNAITGIAARKLVTFGGSAVGSYLAASPPSTGYLISDPITLDSWVEAGQAFGIWTTFEAAARTGSNQIPYQRNDSNFIQRYVGGTGAANTSQIDADTAISATSITAATSSQSGAALGFGPCLMLIETDSGQPFVAAVGDSITYGVGEGVTGSGSNGDTLGSASGSCGFIERAVYDTLGYDGVNFGRGSDGNKYLATASNWQYRYNLLVLANPTHVINANVHNDISATITISGRATSTAYSKWDVYSSSSNLYLITKAGTSSAAASISGTGTAIVDGTAVATYLGPYPGTSVPRGWAQCAAWMANVNSQIQTGLPNAQIIGMLPTPDASSTDSWATAANQTPATGWGDATTRRGLLAAAMRTLPAWLQLAGLINPNTYLENDAAAGDSKWAVNGNASYLTNDGTHPNSTGYVTAVPAVTADLFA